MEQELKDALIDRWLHICLVDNHWITADHEPTVLGEPAMTKESFVWYDTPTELALAMLKGNWNTGAAFAYKDQAWVNQTLGGSEMLVIKQDKSFESMSIEIIAGIGHVYSDNGNYYEYTPVKLRCLVDNIIAIDKATVKECVELDYGKHMVFNRDGVLKQQ